MPGIADPRARGLLLLVLLGIVAAAGLSWLQAQTAQRVREHEARLLLQRLREVLPPPERFDNQPALDRLLVTDPRLGSERALPVYRARRDGRPVAAVLTVVASGYVDEIRLLVGIDAGGQLIGVRAIRHRETPGLGDGIDARRSDWIRQFAGHGAGAALALRRDGGDIDQLSGATITSRAVVKAVRAALAVFAERRAELFASTAASDALESPP